jgi:hypothetical protein
LILKQESHSGLGAVKQAFQRNCSAAAIVDGVTCQLAGGRDNLGLVHEAKSDANSQSPNGLSHAHNIFAGTDF